MDLQQEQINHNIPLKAERLSSQISRLILSEIQSGQLTVGDRLPSETELAQKYGVSRTILREAIASLKNEDILESKQGRGITVKNTRSRQAFRFSDTFKTVPVEEANLFFEMRALLEAQAVGIAAIRRTQEDIDEITKSFSAMEEAIAGKTYGNKIHERNNNAIMCACHNPLMIEFLFFLYAKLQELTEKLSIKPEPTQEVLSEILEEHRQIVKCILDGDSSAAREAALIHFKNAAARVGLDICGPQKAQSKV